jgi:hypothetical protein
MKETQPKEKKKPCRENQALALVFCFSLMPNLKQHLPLPSW